MADVVIVPALTALTTRVFAANAFSGAVGFGAVSTGGSGGTTVYVTILADSGTGSFRDAVSSSNRIVQFNVSGYIQLLSAVSLSSSITIDGTTAPSPGIGIVGGEVSTSGNSNIVIRNLRMRQGLTDPDSGKSAFNAGKASNVILDHCSVEYGQWDSIDVVSTVNQTVSNSIIALPVGQQFGAHLETGPAAFYRNLWVSSHNRNPLVKSNTQYLNNIVYDYQVGYTVANTGGKFTHDIINNYIITGPATAQASNDCYQINSNQEAYVSDNYLDSNNNGKLDGSSASTAGSAVALSSPWASDSVSLASLSAANAYTYVVANVGASPRDEIDTYVVNRVKSLGTLGGLIKNHDSTGLTNNGYRKL